MPESIKLRFEISGDDYVGAGEAAAKLKRTLKNMGYSAAIIRRVSVAMYEAEINMVIHADGGTIDIEIDSDYISLAFRDTGPGIDEIGQAMKEGFSTATDEIRSMGFGAGMGLPNIKNHSDCMKIESVPGVGTTVYVKIATGNDKRK